MLASLLGISRVSTTVCTCPCDMIRALIDDAVRTLASGNKTYRTLPSLTIADADIASDAAQ